MSKKIIAEEKSSVEKFFGQLGVELSQSGKELVGECPFCDREGKFYVNEEKKVYHCQKCKKSGNRTTFLRWKYQQALDGTTLADRRELAARRGVTPQAIKTFGLAYAKDLGKWLIPFKKREGEEIKVVNLMTYDPDIPKPRQNKYLLAGMKQALFNLENLSGDKAKPLYLCEGPFDAIALWKGITSNNRPKYDILAVPGRCDYSPWAEHFRDRKVFGLFDNDKGGRDHGESARKHLAATGVVSELRLLRWEGIPEGHDINDLVKEKAVESIVGFISNDSYPVAGKPKLKISWAEHSSLEEEKLDWIWANRLHCKTYASFSGFRGTFKSTIMRQIAARYSTGQPMPGEDKPTMPAGNVLYISAEDSEQKVKSDYFRFGGAEGMLGVIATELEDGSQLNILENLKGLEQAIVESGARLVIIDGQNSVIGAADYGTDAKGRWNVTGKLHSLAQRLNICLIGMRNESKEGAKYGAASMADLGRIVMRTVEPTDKPSPPGERHLILEWEKVNNAPRELHSPIPYTVLTRKSGAEILWGNRKVTREEAERFIANLNSKAQK